MDDLSKLLTGLTGFIILCASTYQGYRAWLHPDELQIIFIQDAQRRSSWPFSKELIVELTRKYGITATRIGTALLAIVVLLVEAKVLLSSNP